MGDYRFLLKIDFSMGNHRDTTEMWLNWSRDVEHGLMIDRRVVEWLDKNFDLGVADIRENLIDIRQDQITQRERQQRDEDLKRLQELRAKYPDA